MRLYRVIYIRDGKPKGMTISAPCAALAAEAAYTWLQDYILSIGGSWVLTVTPVQPAVKRAARPSKDALTSWGRRQDNPPSQRSL